MIRNFEGSSADTGANSKMPGLIIRTRLTTCSAELGDASSAPPLPHETSCHEQEPPQPDRSGYAHCVGRLDAERLEEGLNCPSRCKDRTWMHAKKKKRCDKHDCAEWRKEDNKKYQEDRVSTGNHRRFRRGVHHLTRFKLTGTKPRRKKDSSRKIRGRRFASPAAPKLAGRTTKKLLGQELWQVTDGVWPNVVL